MGPLFDIPDEVVNIKQEGGKNDDTHDEIDESDKDGNILEAIEDLNTPQIEMFDLNM